MQKKEIEKYIKTKCDGLKFLLKGGSKNIKKFLECEFRSVKTLLKLTH